ncbi:MAG: class IV adenylate cyclase [Thermoproteales archaeon]|nr:class IV adenylate cyclase [Thermoproteales archaeon]RLE66428.1 MAG: class IV adenylate cyclase [Thermoprotei archaeon]
MTSRNIEYEIKIRVKNLDEIREKLTYLGATLQGAGVEEDVYYQHPCRDFKESDEALRIRNYGTIIELTYKGSRLPANIKAREEITVRILREDYSKLKQLLEKLGFRSLARIVKKREIYVYENLTISLDEVEGLGSFMEVEAFTDHKEEAEESIKNFLDLLGDIGEPVSQTYLEMMLTKRH